MKIYSIIFHLLYAITYLSSLLCINLCCSDINECNRGITCGVHGTCENFAGGYRCNCATGYEPNGSVCIGKRNLHKDLQNGNKDLQNGKLV